MFDYPVCEYPFPGMLLGVFELRIDLFAPYSYWGFKFPHSNFIWGTQISRERFSIFALESIHSFEFCEGTASGENLEKCDFFIFEGPADGERFEIPFFQMDG